MMKFKTLMIIKAVVCLFFGVLILAVPEFTYSLFGLTLTAAGVVTARQYGASLVGNLMITWFARNAKESDARFAIILGLFLYDAIGFIVWLIGVLAGLMNTLGWAIVVLYLLLALGFGYFLIKKPQP